MNEDLGFHSLVLHFPMCAFTCISNIIYYQCITNQQGHVLFENVLEMHWSSLEHSTILLFVKAA